MRVMKVINPLPKEVGFLFCKVELVFPKVVAHQIPSYAMAEELEILSGL